MDTRCKVCRALIEEYRDAYSGGWTHVELDVELSADHAAVPMTHAEQRTHELRPLADALTIMVRGFGVTLPDGKSDVRIEQTGGNVYAIVGSIGAWTLYGDECGWSLAGSDGGTVATGVWFDDPDNVYGCLALDPDTGALDPDECDAAAHTFASALPTIIGKVQE